MESKIPEITIKMTTKVVECKVVKLRTSINYSVVPAIGGMEYDAFVKNFYIKYEKKHEACPKCGSTSFRSTLMGYACDPDDLEGYADNNRSTCSDCGNVHKIHDRVEVVPIPFEELK